jgi:ATP-dependent Clp protease ATP-binding subunit ClpC
VFYMLSICPSLFFFLHGYSLLCFQCIAATTLDEHRLHFEKDKALARRFQPVFVNEPSQVAQISLLNFTWYGTSHFSLINPLHLLQEDSVKILLGLREKYETYHKCRYTLEGINAAVYLSARYIPDRHLPDKAIDLIDEAGSRAKMESFKRKKEEHCSILSKSPDEYWQEIRAVQGMHELVTQNFRVEQLPLANILYTDECFL